MLSTTPAARTKQFSDIPQSQSEASRLPDERQSIDDVVVVRSESPRRARVVRKKTHALVVAQGVHC